MKSIETEDDLKSVMKQVSLEAQVEGFSLQDKLEKQDFLFQMMKVFEPAAKVSEETTMAIKQATDRDIHVNRLERKQTETYT